MKLTSVEFNRSERPVGAKSVTTTLRSSDGWMLDQGDDGWVSVLHEDSKSGVVRAYSPTSVRYVDIAPEPVKGKNGK